MKTESSTRPSVTIRRSQLLAIAIVAFAICVLLVLRITSRAESVFTDKEFLQLKLIEMQSAQLRESQEVAAALSEKGEHLAAARALACTAGAHRVLLRTANADDTVAQVPTVTERAALMQFSIAGKADAYRRYLELLYPEWQPEDAQSVGYRPLEDAVPDDEAGKRHGDE